MLPGTRTRDMDKDHVYTDLEYACAFAHKDGRSFCCGHFLDDSHPLMVSMGVKRPVSQPVSMRSLNKAEDAHNAWQNSGHYV